MPRVGAVLGVPSPGPVVGQGCGDSRALEVSTAGGSRGALQSIPSLGAPPEIREGMGSTRNADKLGASLIVSSCQCWGDTSSTWHCWAALGSAGQRWSAPGTIGQPWAVQGKFCLYRAEKPWSALGSAEKP